MLIEEIGAYLCKLAEIRNILKKVWQLLFEQKSSLVTKKKIVWRMKHHNWTVFVYVLPI